MAPIALALFEAILGRSVCMHVYFYIHMYIYIYVLSSSTFIALSLWKSQISLKRLEWNHSRGWSCQTPGHRHSGQSDTPQHFSDHNHALPLLTSLYLYLHSMVIVCPGACSTKPRQRLRLFSLPAPTRVPPGRRSLLAGREQLPLAPRARPCTCAAAMCARLSLGCAGRSSFSHWCLCCL